MTKLKKLSGSELEIMLIIWEAKEPVTASCILEKLMGKRSWALSTLMTVLARLVKKGYLFCDRSTRSNYYRPIVEEEYYKEQESRAFLKDMYGSSLPKLISSLYSGGAISDSDLDELQHFIDSAKKEQ